eukprot:c841_g1_i1.p1 GENE.c841_g1_i1~~c841_g1_i1.p1  ORF type:complete len:439 (+),score=98.77 c841_g1_i1:115-1317(+)
MPMRELYPLMRIPGMINLGNGMPNPQTFPFENVKITCRDGTAIELKGNELDSSLQYSATDGVVEMVDWLKQHIAIEHSPPKIHADREVMVTCGSQDGLAKAFDMLIDSTTPVIVEDPTYPGALQALRAIGCPLLGVPIDEHGIVPSKLEELIHYSKKSGIVPRVLYVIPTGQNPSGSSMTASRRAEVYQIAQRENLIILEDDPYYYLRFERAPGDDPKTKSFLSIDRDGRVLRFDSFSKVFSSGLRLGWVTGPPELINPIRLHQQVSTMQASTLCQVITAKLLQRWGNDGFQHHVNTIQSFYRSRRDRMCGFAHQYIGDLATWNPPSAGMFLWINCKNITDTRAMIKQKAVERKVLFVPGTSFSVDPNAPSSYVRAAFSMASEDSMEEAIRRLGQLMREA